MTEPSIFVEEQLLLPVTTWTLDETILTPVKDSAFDDMALPKEVRDEFHWRGCWIHATRIPVWSSHDFSDPNTKQIGKEVIVTIGRFNHSTEVTLRHGQKVIVRGLNDLELAPEQAA